MSNQYVRRQSEVITVPANAIGVNDHELQLDRNYSRVTGITIYNRGVHTQYQVGIKPKRGVQLEDICPWEQYSQTETERYMPAYFAITNERITIETSVDVQSADAIDYVIVFTLEK